MVPTAHATTGACMSKYWQLGRYRTIWISLDLYCHRSWPPWTVNLTVSPQPNYYDLSLIGHQDVSYRKPFFICSIRPPLSLCINDSFYYSWYGRYIFPPYPSRSAGPARSFTSDPAKCRQTLLPARHNFWITSISTRIIHIQDQWPASHLELHLHS